MPVLDVEKLIENRVKAIRDYHEVTGIKRAQLDVSGGVDSAVMLGLLARAVGPENITAVYSSIHSSASSRERALEVSNAFNVELMALDLTEDFNNLSEHLIEMACKKYTGTEYMSKDSKGHKEVIARLESDPTILGSFRSCIRAPIGRFMNRLMGNGIRHGTGNECEDRWLRFYQKGGDGEVDTNPLAMLSKGEVYQLAIGLGVPDSILKATPSPDLQGVGEDGHNDEDELLALTGVGWTYSRVLMQDMPERGLKRGDYTYVGTIERMSRHIDGFIANTLSWQGDSVDEAEEDGQRSWDNLVQANFPDGDFDSYFDSYNKIEQQTRHKMNPNCPSLGSRKSLLKRGILTNALPKV